MNKKSIRLSLDISPDLNSVLEEMARKTHSSKSDVLRKSIARMRVTVDEERKGNHLGVIAKDQKIREIVGI